MQCNGTRINVLQSRFSHKHLLNEVNHLMGHVLDGDQANEPVHGFGPQLGKCPKLPISDLDVSIRECSYSRAKSVDRLLGLVTSQNMSHQTIDFIQ